MWIGVSGAILWCVVISPRVHTKLTVYIHRSSPILSCRLVASTLSSSNYSCVKFLPYVCLLTVISEIQSHKRIVLTVSSFLKAKARTILLGGYPPVYRWMTAKNRMYASFWSLGGMLHRSLRRDLEFVVPLKFWFLVWVLQ